MIRKMELFNLTWIAIGTRSACSSSIFSHIPLFPYIARSSDQNRFHQIYSHGCNGVIYIFFFLSIEISFQDKEVLKKQSLKGA